MDIYESGQMYLETILVLKKEKGNVHAVDICEHLGFAKSSVSGALSALKEKGYISVVRGSIMLTEKGEAMAKSIYERHHVITRYLVGLGVSEETASEDACRMEHTLSEETYRIFKSIVEAKEN